MIERVELPEMKRLLSPMLNDLRQRYSEPQRHYHNLQHIHSCLEELEANLNLCHSPGTVFAAIWFHDCVYDPTRADNEERSAEIASQMLEAAGLNPSAIDHVRRLILATRHHQPAQDQDEAVMVDIDLAILGKPAADFDVYERAIRMEYAHIPDTAFAAGRSKVLRHFLLKPRIFQTEPFHYRFESTARANLSRSLKKLASVT